MYFQKVFAMNPSPHKPRTTASACASALFLATMVLHVPVADAAAVSARPQIVFALGNSQSMDGTLSGAIMTGSGMLDSDTSLKSLSASSSPVNYAVPAGFVPPKQAAVAGQAPYTVKVGGTWYDNGASRLNVAKAGIADTLNKYLPTMDFSLVTYQTSGSSLYTTWAYHMSPVGGFKFTNTQVPPLRYVANPCYTGTSTSAGLSATVASNCTAFASLYNAAAAPGGIYANRYIQVSSSADDASVNDVLYASNLSALWVSYGTVKTGNGITVTPPNTNTPYTAYGLGNELL